MKKYVVVLHYKTIEKTIECVESILKNAPLYNILIVDNNSANGTLEELHKSYDSNNSVEFLEISDNIGFARANNAAMKKLLSMGVHYAILSNNDIVFSKDAIGNMFSCFENRNEAIIVCPKVLDPSGAISNTVQKNRNNRKSYFWDKFFANKSKNFAAQCDEICEVAEFSGCCFACDLLKMQKIGFFDEYTFLYFEEPIVAQKTHKNGLKIFYAPSAEVVHYHGISTKAINHLVLYYMLDSEIYYLSKYLKINWFVLDVYCAIKRFIHHKKYSDGDLYRKETEILNKIKKGEYEKS